ncbi:MAG: SsrA-binding protein SmpB [Phycisphaerae bacterium]|nr:SsrA-binding protein SmpB [Phycisphaerae bacterium]
MAGRAEKQPKNSPTIENRRAFHDYSIGETVECGMELKGTEVKSVRASQVSIAEGFVMAEGSPLQLALHGVHIAEYPPAGRDRQHDPTRVRRLLASRREIERLAGQVQAKGVSLVPLKIYFKNGFAKLLIGVGTGKSKVDKRQSIAKRESQRDIDRAMHRRR